MYWAFPASRHVASTSVRQCGRGVKRRLATEAALKPKKKGIVRRLFWATTTLTGTFYVGSTFIAFSNQTYYDFFSDNVPLGQPMLEYAEARGWDTLTVEDIIESGKTAVITAQQLITGAVGRTPQARDSIESTKAATEKSVNKAQASTLNIVQTTKTKVEKVVEKVNTEIKDQANKITQKKEAIASVIDHQASDELLELIRRAEAAIAGKPCIPVAVERKVAEFVETPPIEGQPVDRNVYSAPLPIGFEPPPGFSRPTPPKNAGPASGDAEAKHVTQISLPLVAPTVSSLGASEPIIVHLACTIDNLASFLESNPAAATNATDILEAAKDDLAALVKKIEKVKEDGRSALEAKLDEQTRGHTLKLIELEMEAQDKLDGQEEGFRKFFEEERSKFIEAYRAKLDHELRTQTEFIHERLKEEVIAQGIELQRRWIREIKVRVEQERGGRLAKLDELAADLKRLERIALDNSTYLDENIRVHVLWSAVRALNSTALSSQTRKPFREELRILRHISEARENPLISTVLETLEASDLPDVGIEPFSDLASWFTTSVAPKVSDIALVPDENAGLLSYLASRVLSGLRFTGQGLVPGDDVLSVLSRAGYYLNEKDLDSATRELNQLKGPAKLLLKDWLEAARRRLEVKQALDAIQAEATLSSLLVV